MGQSISVIAFKGAKWLIYTAVCLISNSVHTEYNGY